MARHGRVSVYRRDNDDQATDNKLKPMSRIFKNMRSKMIDDGIIAKASAPSYYVEGLLYNVPDGAFTGNYQDTALNILKWFYNTPDRKDFVCANEQYYLLRDGYHTCWPCADGANFINGAIKLWNEWNDDQPFAGSFAVFRCGATGIPTTIAPICA